VGVGAVNRGKAVLPMVLIRHLGQILDVHTQSVMMSDLSIAVAPRLDFLTAPLYSLLGQQA